MKHKRIIKIIIAFTLVTSIITNSVGNLFAQQEEQIEEVTTESYESDVEGKEEVGIPERESSLELEDLPIDKQDESSDQEEESAMYTLSKSKFYDIHATIPGSPSSIPVFDLVKFTDEPLPAGVTAVDLSESGDGSVIGGIEVIDPSINAKNLIVTTNTSGEKIKFPQDSSYLFSRFSSNGNVSGLSHYAIDLSNVDTSNVVNMKGMFAGLSRVTSLDLSNFNTSNVNNMAYMFDGCSQLVDIDLSSFNTKSVSDMQYMFSNCIALKDLDLRHFNTNNVSHMRAMFFNCRALKTLDISSFQTSLVFEMDYMFNYCKSLTTLDLSNFNTSNVRNMMSMFEECSALSNLNLSSFDTRRVEDMNNMFKNNISLKQLDLSSFNTSNVVSMERMFENCSSLVEINFSEYFNTGNVINMQSMFQNCSSLTSLDLSSFDTSNVKYINHMFHSCRSLNELDLSNFNTQKVENMTSMFKDCNSLNKLYLTNFNTESAVYMGWMFAGCSSLTTIYSEEWDISKVTTDTDMFLGCEQVVGKSEYAITTPFDPNRIGKEAATPNNGYFTVPNLEVWNATVKYVNENNQVLVTKDFLATNKQPEITTEKINEFMPNGYELVDENTSLTVTQDNQVFEIEIRKIQWTLELEYQTVDGNVVKTEAIQVTQLNPIVTAQTITEKVPTGYELVDTATDWTATSNGDKKVIQVRETEWAVNLEYQTADGTVVKTEAIQVTQLNPVVTAQTITEEVPVGYELVEEASDWTATANGDKKVIQVREVEWTVSLEYQTADGTIIKTEAIQVTQLNPVVTEQTITEKVPTGYELVDTATDWTATSNGDKKVIQVREVEWTVSLEYQTADGTVIKTEEIQVMQLNPVVTAQTITEKVPTGYELAEEITDWTATVNGDKKVIQVREIKWTVELEYQTQDGTVVKTEAIQVTQLNPVVTAQTITEKVPTGYELVAEVSDWETTIQGEKKVVEIKEIEWTIMIEFITENSRGIVDTVAFTVGNLNPVIAAEKIIDSIPKGYYALDEIKDLRATKDGEVFQVAVEEIEEWEGIVHFVDQNGITIKTEVYIVTNENPIIHVEKLEKALPMDATLVKPLTELMVTKDKEEFIIEVIMPVDQESNQPEIGGDDDTTDAKKPEGSIESVQTGDSTHVRLWGMIMGGSIGILAYLKRKKKSM